MSSPPSFHLISESSPKKLSKSPSFVLESSSRKSSARKSSAPPSFVFKSSPKKSTSKKSTSNESSPKKLSLRKSITKKSSLKKSTSRKSSLRKSITRKFSRSKSLNILLNSENKSISKKRRRPFSARLSRKSKSKSKSKSNEISFTLPPGVPGGTQNKKLRKAIALVINELRGTDAFKVAGKERQKRMQEEAVAPLIEQLNKGLEEYKKKNNLNHVYTIRGKYRNAPKLSKKLSRQFNNF